MGMAYGGHNGGDEAAPSAEDSRKTDQEFSNGENDGDHV